MPAMIFELSRVPLFLDLYPGVDMSLYPDYKSRALNLFKYELIKRLQHIGKAEAYKTKILHTMSILYSCDTPLNSAGINS